MLQFSVTDCILSTEKGRNGFDNNSNWNSNSSSCSNNCEAFAKPGVTQRRLMSPSLSLLHQREKVVNHGGGATPIGPSDANETKKTTTGRRIEKQHHHHNHRTEKRKKTKVLPACKKKRIAKRGFRDPSGRGPGDTGLIRPMSGKDPAKDLGGQPRGGIDPGGGGGGGSSVPTTDGRRPPPPAVAGPTEVSPSRAQTDIRKLLDALSEYAYDTNSVADDNHPTASGGGGGHSKSRSKIRAISDDYTGPDAAAAALPPLLAQIPNTLVGFVGTHCEVDVAAVSQAAEGILEFSSSKDDDDDDDDDNNPRSRLLRNEFHRVLRSGGTAMVLQAIARMMNRHGTSMTMSTSTTMSTTMTTTIATAGDPPPDDNAGRPEHEAAFEAVFRCWGVVRVGIVSGLSTNTLVLVVRSCVHGMNELEKVWNETSAASTRGGGGGGGTRDGGGGKLLFDTLGRVLEILLQAIASPRMTADALCYDQTSILASLLALLGQACCCSDGDDDPSAEAAIIGLIEDLLGILVVCARKGLIQGHDFQRLVPACQASLSRFQLATAGSDSGCGGEAPSAAVGSDGGIGIGKTIVVRVVELIELEDKTVGLWLRHTYGITAPPPPSGDQQRQSQQPQQQQAESGVVDLSWRSAAEAVYERAASTFGGERRQRRRTERTDDDDDEDDNPSPPQQRELFPSIAVGPPDRLDRENDDDDDDDEGGDY